MGCLVLHTLRLLYFECCMLHVSHLKAPYSVLCASYFACFGLEGAPYFCVLRAPHLKAPYLGVLHRASHLKALNLHAVCFTLYGG